MSLTKLVFPSLAWSELWNVLAFLSLQDLWRLGTTCRSAFITFLREKTYREGLQSRGFTISSYHHHASFLCKYSKHDKVLLVSYPRSGNSFVRKILELKTGIVTGSDSRPNRSLAASLLKFGYCGEGIYDQSVWVVKSHYPERLGFIRFPVHRVILVVRNPFDAIESYFHMGMTNTHDKVLSDEAFQSLFSVWKEFLVNEAKVWTEFHQFWLNLINNHLPILIVRYEDLLMNESYWMQQIIQFIELGQKPAGHQRYLKQIEDNRTNAVGYNPKNSRVGKSFQAIPEHEFKTIENETKKFLELFQYQLDSNDPSRKPVLKMGEFDPKTLQSYVNTDSSSRIDDVSKSTGISSSNSPGFLLVNDNINIRSAEDKFGRRITELRKSYTKNDQLPFATK